MDQRRRIARIRQDARELAEQGAEIIGARCGGLRSAPCDLVLRWLSERVEANLDEGVIEGAGLLLSKGNRLFRRATIPDVRQGRAMRLGRSMPRRDPLSRTIDAALSTLPPSVSAMDVLRRMEEIGGVIQEVDWDNPEQPIIYWRGSRGERKTTFKAFQNRVTDRKKISHT